MTHARTALVIGGGIAGPVAAMALQKAGIQATVYEAYENTAQGVGAFLTIASNGIDALRTIGADGLALAAGFPTPRIMLRSGTGKNLGTVGTGLSLPDGTTSHTLKRAASDTADIMKASPTHSVPHLPAWHAGRMIVIGDAAHAPTPTSGQGASLSIEDAVLLARCLRDLPDVQRAFAHFEALRRPRAERIIKQAARINSSKAAGPVARVFRDAMLPVILKMTANSKQVNEVYRYHIDWAGPVTPARS